MERELIFSIIFIIFSAVMVLAGVYTKRWVSETSDYILAGREVSLPINIIGVSAIGFAGTTISLAPGFAILYGLKGSWLWGIIYAAAGLVFYGLVFGKIIRRSGAQTLPEYLEMRFSARVRNIVSIGTIIGLCGILANNIVTCVLIVSNFIGWDPVFVTAIIFAIIIIFTTLSGIWATTVTDFFQVTIGTIVVPVFLFLAMNRYGGFEYLKANWNGGDIFNMGYAGGMLKGMSFQYPSILTFIILFSTALVLGNNYYWMKAAACRSEKIARNSFVIAGLFLIVIFMIPLGIIGAYAVASNPQIYTVAGGKVPPVAAYGAFAKTFMPFISSLFVVGAIAASVSTSSTSALGATSTATRDIYQRMLKPNADAKTTLKASKVIMFLIGIFTWALTFFPGGPTYLFAFANAWLVPPAVLLVLGLIWPRFNKNGAFWGVVFGIITMATLTLLDLLKIYSVAKFTHIAIVGLLVTLGVGAIASFMQTENPKRKNENYKLTKEDIVVLDLLNIGQIYMSDITDYLGVDSKESQKIVENLIVQGYIRREGQVGAKYFTLNLTDKVNVEELTKVESNLLEKGLNLKYVEFLEAVKESNEKVKSFVKDNTWNSLKISSITTHLVRNGYLVEKGLFKRRLEITTKGLEVIG